MLSPLKVRVPLASILLIRNSAKVVTHSCGLVSVVNQEQAGGTNVSYGLILLPGALLLAFCGEFSKTLS